MHRLKLKNGFTLIELIMVMSIIGLVLVSISDYLIESTNSFRMDNDRMSVYDATSEALDSIVTTVFHTTPSMTVQATGDNRIYVFRRGANAQVYVLDSEVDKVTFTTITSGDQFVIQRGVSSSVTFSSGANEGLEINVEGVSGNYSHVLSGEAYFRNK